MKVPGTSVTAEDVEGGVAISFTTTGDVTELRARVHRMAGMHAQMMSGGMKSEKKGNGGMMGGGMKMVPSKATAEDIEHGARIVLVPEQPDQLAALRERVHAHATRMASGTCPMMEQS